MGLNSVFYHTVMHSKDDDRIANSVDTDQTALHLKIITVTCISTGIMV